MIVIEMRNSAVWSSFLTLYHITAGTVLSSKAFVYNKIQTYKYA